MGQADGEFAARLVASLRSGLLAVDADGRLRCANDEARRVLALPAPEAGRDPLLGFPFEEAFAGRPALVELFRDALAGREPPSRAELHLDATPTAPAATLGFTLTTVRAADGSTCGAALTFRDLQPLERLGEGERLRERLVALGEMAAGLAHEIRNPLASLGVHAGLLARRLGADPEAREMLGELLGEIRTLQATVSAALDYVKPAPPPVGEVDLGRLLDEALAQARDGRPFEGRIERAPGEAPRVAGDRDQLRSVLLNLLSNAIEATRELGTQARIRVLAARRPVPDLADVLRVRASESVPRRAAHEAVVEVADNGPGVPDALRERIFYPFFTTRESGSGIGLAVAQKIAVAHGGGIELESGQRGARFRLRLPIRGGGA